MSKWEIRYHSRAAEELDELDGSVKKQIMKGILKVSANPVSVDEGGYGKPLGNKGGNNLTNLFKIKFKQIGFRIVYSLEKEKREDSEGNEEYIDIMKILVISVRADEIVYKLAFDRKGK